MNEVRRVVLTNRMLSIELDDGRVIECGDKIKEDSLAWRIAEATFKMQRASLTVTVIEQLIAEGAKFREK
jgi:hypothetical protein